MGLITAFADFHANYVVGLCIALPMIFVGPIQRGVALGILAASLAAMFGIGLARGVRFDTTETSDLLGSIAIASAIAVTLVFLFDRIRRTAWRRLRQIEQHRAETAEDKRKIDELNRRVALEKTRALLEKATRAIEAAETLVDSGYAEFATGRAYYAMFYMLLTLNLKMGVNMKTSKHAGVISMFDKEFVLSGKIDRKYSKMLHSIFDDRQEFDYKELVEVSEKDGIDAIDHAEDFINGIKQFIKEIG